MADNSLSPHTPNSDDVHSTDPSQMANDAEGVWSPDIEQSFQEALAIYPPCGRRKIILSDEGKMYGRNELIARYIKLRTGKTRSRKQVSSHIQVLARRKAREIQAKLKCTTNSGSGIGFKDQGSKDKALQAMATMSSAQIVSATALHAKFGLPPGMEVPVTATIKTEMGALSPQSQFWPPGTAPQSGSSPPLGYPYNSSVAPYYASAVTHSPGMPQATGLTQASTVTISTPTGQSTVDQLRDSYGTPTGVAGSAIMVPNTGQPWPSRPAQQAQRQHMPLHLLEFSAFLETQRMDQPDSYHKHLFVHLGPHAKFNDPMMEAIDIRQIYDKFPEKKGGLKELYERGPNNLFFLVKFWGDLNTNISDDAGAFYGVSSTYESSENMTITCSTKVCSFGKQVVEKVETEYPRYENGRFVYRIHRSPMCEYMINFIHKLKHLPEKFMMNSVLENFTILQVVSNRDTQETLLCLAYVFEVSSGEHGAQHHIYKLVTDPTQ